MTKSGCLAGVVFVLIALLAVDTVLADFTGPVISVLDGDTIEILHDRHPKRVRLHGIDCPEKDQAYGHAAKLAASVLVFGKEVTIHPFGKDKYGRTIADVFLLDGTNVNHELVKDGWCWWYREYAPGDRELERLEQDAREAKKGLWGDPAPVPPWVYRKARRGNSLDLSELVPFENETGREASPRVPPKHGLAQSDDPPEIGLSPYLIIGNRRSYFYHCPGCQRYSHGGPHNRVTLTSAVEAEETEYRVAGVCL